MKVTKDYSNYDSEDFTIEALVSSIRGESKEISPSIAVALLQAKLGEDGVATLTALALDSSVNLRGRYAATLALAPYESARDTLSVLARSPDKAIAAAAVQAQNPPPA